MTPLSPAKSAAPAPAPLAPAWATPAEPDGPVEVSVCIANWNCRELLRDCLGSLLDCPQGVRLEVIVVDNASSDGAAEMVAREYPEVEVQRYHADALAALLVRDPGRFDVIVASNLIGDILTDLAGALQGSLGLPASANLNPEHLAPSLFEPVPIKNEAKEKSILSDEQKVTDNLDNVESIEDSEFIEHDELLPSDDSDDDFEKIDIRVGKIIQVDDFPQARKPAYKLTIDFGPEIGIKRSSAQITNYPKEELLGKLVIGVVNFPPRQIGPFRSEVLTLGAPDGSGKVILLTPTHEVPLGGKIF